MTIQILDEAVQDLIDGTIFYERQEQGLGAYFMDSISADIDSLLVYAGIHTVFFGRYYRLLAKRFPFAVYYRVENLTVLIHAVLDCRRSPAWARKRLEKQ